MVNLSLRYYIGTFLRWFDYYTGEVVEFPACTTHSEYADPPNVTRGAKVKINRSDVRAVSRSVYSEIPKDIFQGKPAITPRA